MINKMHGISFGWQEWRAGDPTDVFEIQCREKILLNNKETLKQYAIGYCKGEELICRPKKGTFGVMFLKDNIEFWFHLTIKEFNKIIQER